MPRLTLRAKRFSNGRDEELSAWILLILLFWFESRGSRSDPNNTRSNNHPMIVTTRWNSSMTFPSGSWMALDSVLVDVLWRRLTLIDSRFCNGVYPQWHLNVPGNCLIYIEGWTIPYMARFSLAWATVQGSAETSRMSNQAPRNLIFWQWRSWRARCLY